MLGTGGDVDTMGTEREPGNLTCLARLGTGGDVDTMGTLQAQIYLMKQKRIAVASENKASNGQ